MDVELIYNLPTVQFFITLLRQSVNIWVVKCSLEYEILISMKTTETIILTLTTAYFEKICKKIFSPERIFFLILSDT